MRFTIHHMFGVEMMRYLLFAIAGPKCCVWNLNVFQLICILFCSKGMQMQFHPNDRRKVSSMMTVIKCKIAKMHCHRARTANLAKN